MARVRISKRCFCASSRLLYSGPSASASFFKPVATVPSLSARRCRSSTGSDGGCIGACNHAVGAGLGHIADRSLNGGPVFFLLRRELESRLERCDASVSERLDVCSRRLPARRTVAITHLIGKNQSRAANHRCRGPSQYCFQHELPP